MLANFRNLKNKLLSRKKTLGPKHRVYFDSASATPILQASLKSFLETTFSIFANASSIHAEGEKSKEVLYEARKRIAKCMHAKPNNLHFTASTTEANNIFIKGIVLNSKIHPDFVSTSFNKERDSAPHIIYSSSDHSAIVDVVESCKLFGAKFSSVRPNKIGILPTEEILKQININTRLICFSYVSSELGTVQPVRKIVLAVREYCEKNNFPKENWPKIFIDATQAVKYESIDVGNLLVDGMSFGSAKIGGVSGAAVLYVKNETKLIPIISGGGQEESVRSGTENLGAIVAFASALEQTSPVGPTQTNPLIRGTQSAQDASREKVFKLRNYCIEQLRKNFKTNLHFVPSLSKEGRDEVRGDFELEIFGDTNFKREKFYEYCAPHILLINLVDMLGEETLLRLDAKGISVSTASACSLLENSGSNFLKSIGEPVKAKETIRLSFSEHNTTFEIDYFVKSLREIKEKFIK